MKNKKGFTLVELLAVVALLAELAAVATPAITSISQKSKEKMYNAKKKEIETAAVLCSEKNRSSSDCDKVSELCSGGYLTYEGNNICQKNPLTDHDMKNCSITVSFNSTTNRYTATLASSCKNV